MFALNLDVDHRILSATLDRYAPQGQPRVDSLPGGNICDWKYIDGEYVYDPLPEPEPPAPSEDEVWKQETDEAICELYELIEGGVE